ncbi:MBL fold metallo-hydrolase [Periweissella fabalis]|uniref:MBL fold metallo-hydrolase n=1 Tax=Periweissella fabalis TaxID=1070421 RepID=A0A7X6N3X5_9LACO|nr:MBL fold metallo-hydrolase [Periweissella fabalis]MCM0598539.1 MBL fold metallo-hydrolase [Periweissella fabalis]NKZ24179.1 MBL fold metallo-hydrolase [Periweissella fabalis]
MKLTIIGCLGGYPANGKATSCFLLSSHNFNLLIDCGSGALLALQKVISPLQLDAVVLTHFHADHIADVGVLQHFWQLAPGDKKVPWLPIYASNHDIENFNKLDWPYSTRKQALNFSKPMEIGPFTLSFFKTKHPVETYAVRIKETGNQNELVYTADTTIVSGLNEFIDGAHTVLTDTNFFANQKGPRWHLTTTETTDLANNTHVKQVILTHIPPFGDLDKLKYEVASKLMPNIKLDVADEGAIYEL